MFIASLNSPSRDETEINYTWIHSRSGKSCCFAHTHLITTSSNGLLRGFSLLIFGELLCLSLRFQCHWITRTHVVDRNMNTDIRITYEYESRDLVVYFLVNRVVSC